MHLRTSFHPLHALPPQRFFRWGNDPRFRVPRMPGSIVAARPPVTRSRRIPSHLHYGQKQRWKAQACHLVPGQAAAPGAPNTPRMAQLRCRILGCQAWFARVCTKAALPMRGASWLASWLHHVAGLHICLAVLWITIFYSPCTAAKAAWAWGDTGQVFGSLELSRQGWSVVATDSPYLCMIQAALHTQTLWHQSRA